MDVGYVWLGGDHLRFTVHNDGGEPVSDISLRLFFGSGDDRPWSVTSGIRGYRHDGTMLLEPESLGPGEVAEVMMVVPHQKADRWTLSWTSAEGTSEQTGEIIGG